MAAEAQPVKLLYFAWVREKVGRAEDLLALPAGVATVEALIAHLQTLGPNYQAAFARADVIRVALDRRHVKASAALGEAREIAFFPPVTGG